MHEACAFQYSRELWSVWSIYLWKIKWTAKKPALLLLMHITKSDRKIYFFYKNATNRERPREMKKNLWYLKKSCTKNFAKLNKLIIMIIIVKKNTFSYIIKHLQLIKGLGNKHNEFEVAQWKFDTCLFLSFYLNFITRKNVDTRKYRNS